LVAAVSLVAAACSGTTTGPVPLGEITVLDRSVWSGGTVRIRSGDFRTFGDGAVLDIGSESLALERLDETTLVAILPALPSMVLEPTVRFDGFSFPVQSISVAGFVDAELVPDASSWFGDGQLAMLNNQPHAIGFTSRDLVLVNLLTGVTNSYPNLHDFRMPYGPGPTWDPAIWIVDPTMGPVKLVSLPSGTIVDSLPEIQSQFTDVVARPSPDVWARYAKSNELYWTFRPAPDSAYQSVTDHLFLPSPHALVLSPRGDRIALISHSPPGEAPVLDPVVRDVAFQARRSHLATFSPDGTDLVMVSRERTNDLEGTYSLLRRYRATDGAILANDSLDAAIHAIGIDPDDRWLFVAIGATDPGETPVWLEVRDPTTLAIVAVLHPGDAAPTCSAACSGIIGFLADRVLLFGGFGGPQAIWRFSMPE
jgi:hypothetical protein